MPPKKAAVAPAEGVDGTAAGAIAALCHLIMNSNEFKVDNEKLAPILGLKQGKNVPRKIDSIIKPYGFEFKGGKIVNQDGTAAASSNTGAAEGGKDAKTTKGQKAPKGNPAKKRKLAASTLEEDDSDRVKGEDDQEV